MTEILDLDDVYTKTISAEIINQFTDGAIDFHCHGVGPFDFTEIDKINLSEIENILAARQQKAVLTMYLPQPNFYQFLALVESFHEGKLNGKFQHITGFGLEGPLLGSHGGTPKKGVWMPNREQWEDLAACGQMGLLYVIFSPDAYLSGSNFEAMSGGPSIAWITETLLEEGVLPAPGHFLKTDPIASAKALQLIFDIVAAGKCYPTITDHLYNDMPCSFKHAWRTPEEKLKRMQEIQQLDLASWDLDTIEKKLGIVPAVIIKNARKGIVKVCQNFDGEHVDLLVVKKTVELLGAENMLMMTDSIESKRLAGHELYMRDNSGLLYQEDGIVAAGSKDTLYQIRNMIAIGLNPEQIKKIVKSNPQNILQKIQTFREEHSFA